MTNRPQIFQSFGMLRPGASLHKVLAAASQIATLDEMTEKFIIVTGQTRRSGTSLTTSSVRIASDYFLRSLALKSTSALHIEGRSSFIFSHAFDSSKNGK